jgi:UDP-glucose 4-epimerase
MVDLLARRGAEIVVIDDLRQGHRQTIPRGVELVEGSISNVELLDAVLSKGTWRAVFHFAAVSLVGESMREPLRYLQENAGGGMALISACVKHGVTRFVLSSTANVFGEPERVPIDEDARISPSSPYGESKLMIERALHWAGLQHGMRYACLRYFNAAGADPTGRLGEDHTPETHLIPLVIDAALGRRATLRIFGADYPTPDGTCIRDYVHVSDLCDAHLLALHRMEDGNVTYNLGNGTGYSVLEVVAAVEKVSGRRVPFEFGDRRPGDPATLVAASDRARRESGWQPRFTALDAMVRTAYDWRVRHRSGYRAA